MWGNHSDTQVPDVSHAFVINEGGIFGAGATAPVKALIQDKAFLTNDLMTLVRRRGKAIVRARRVTPAMSAARAIADHLRDLWFGSEPGEWSSMGVMSDGNPYGVQPGIFFSFPVRIKAGGQWSFVGGLDLDEELRDKLSVRRHRTIFFTAGPCFVSFSLLLFFFFFFCCSSVCNCPHAIATPISTARSLRSTALLACRHRPRSFG